MPLDTNVLLCQLYFLKYKYLQFPNNIIIIITKDIISQV